MIFDFPLYPLGHARSLGDEGNPPFCVYSQQSTFENLPFVDKNCSISIFFYGIYESSPLFHTHLIEAIER